MAGTLAVQRQPGFGRERLLVMVGDPSQTLRQAPAQVETECCHFPRHVCQK